MQLVWRRIQESLEKHRRAALISVIKVDGSAPREVGARMVVQQDRIDTCMDAEILDRWTDNVLGAKTAAKVLT